MAKIPYLVRRKNVFYFRLGVPADLREIIKTREIFQSLRTQDSDEAARRALKLAAHFKSLLHDLKTGKTSEACRLSSWDLTPDDANLKNCAQKPGDSYQTVTSPPVTETRQAPLLSVVIGDFQNRYAQSNKATYTKLIATLPLLVELVGDKPINQILQTDLNGFFDDVQRLPVKRKQKTFAGMTTREIIAANSGGRTIAAGTFESTYKSCLSIFISWALTNYKDQGFPALSVDGAVYRGERGDGINKQRAATPEELHKLFNNPKMQKYATNPETEHYFWLPALGLYTGARINELCQLNPFEDIKQDSVTGIYYLSITDESETAEGVDKSIKTNSSRRAVPIHSKLLQLGFLHYVERVRKAGDKILFPAWQPRDGKASANASKWFTRYLEAIGLRDETPGARLSGFHTFRHSFVTFRLNNKIQGTLSITGHSIDEVEGFGKISDVARGYWTRNLTDDIQARKDTVEQFDFGVVFCNQKP